MTYRTRDEINAAMLAEVPSNWDKSVGSFVFDVLKAAALELETLHRESEATLERMFLETTSGDSLVLKAADYGIEKVEAAKAEGVVLVTGSKGSVVHIDDLFSADDILFKATEEVTIPSDVSVGVTPNAALDNFTTSGTLEYENGTKTKFTADVFPDIVGGGSLDGSTDYYLVEKDGDSFKIALTPGGTAINISNNGTNVAFAPDDDERVVAVEVEASDAGEAGNVPALVINGFPVTLTGISAVTNEEETTGGVDEETDESLRERALDVVRSKRTSGNAADYEAWAREVPGVGNARCVPLWDGPGTVKVLIVDDDFEIPSGDIVTDTAAYIEERRPVGADVTVAAATEVKIAVRATITLVSGAIEAQVQAELDAAILAYCREQSEETNKIGWAAIANIVFDNIWVEDYTSVETKGTGGSQAGTWGEDNIICTDEECPVFDALTLTVV